MKLTLLLVPSRAAALELPRRLATAYGAQAGLLPMRLMDLARALAEPVLLGRGLRPWDAGHGALLAARLLDEAPPGPLPATLPRAPVARVVARTFAELRLAGLGPEALTAVATRVASGDDRERLAWLAHLYRGFHETLEARFGDAATFLRTAEKAMVQSPWLREADVLIAGELELAPLEESFLAALAAWRSVRRIAIDHPPSLRAGAFAHWAERHGIAAATAVTNPLAPLFVAPGGGRLICLRERLFEAPAGEAARDDSVELLTAPGEAAEVRAVARRILREAARGVPFEDMAVLLPRPEEYTRLFADLLARLHIPYRLHPSLPLRFGRAGRSLLLLFRCRGLRRSEVLEFLTFAPVPYAQLLGPDVVPRVAQWDVMSREAGIVSGLDRWEKGTAAFAADQEREAARVAADEIRRESHLKRVADAAALMQVITQLHATLQELSGEASWAVWAERLLRAFDRWIAPVAGEAAERQVVRELLQSLASLGFVAATARWDDVETVLESRLEWERLPLEPLETGGVHVGSLDAMAGLPFRWIAVPGLVEGGFPGVLRPDPLLLDAEREELTRAASPTPAPPAPTRVGQLSLFDDEPTVPPPAGGGLRTTQDRLLAARRAFHLALTQATERLVLSYPRADPHSGRERLPSLFFVAAASAISGRTVTADELNALVVEDADEIRPLEDALDASERDRARVRSGGAEAALAIAAGSSFFKQSHLASHARWSSDLTAYDGLVAGPTITPEIAARLDPAAAPWPISASRLATYAQCGFKYLLQYVLRLEAADEPEERLRLDPLERGSLFHEIAERFLRERRDAGELPVRDTEEERARLRALGDESLEALVAGAPPRFTVLWQRERERVHDGLATWLTREARNPDTLPLHFEVGFGLRAAAASGEPHSEEPVTVDIGDNRTLRVSGKIDRIDRRADGGLVIRDYKTGRAPRKDDTGLFRGGRQLQIPFYVLAAAQLFPGQRVVQAFLDYVDGGRRVEFDIDGVTGEGFRSTLRAITSSIAQGNFVQDHQACEWCEFTGVCGPRRLIELRRSYKVNDRRVLSYLRLRDIP